MSIQHANRGIVKNNLQLYYNREYAKSFRGEATTNIAYVVNSFLNSNANWWTNSGATIFNDNDTSLPKPVILNIDTTNLRIFSSTVTAVGNQQLGSSIIPISPSTQYTMSIYYWFSGTSMQAQPYLRTNVNNNSLANFAYNGDTNYLNWPRRTWIRLSATFTTQANETGVYMSSYTGDTAGEKLAYFGYQLEQRSYATPLVLGARAIATTNLLTATYSTLPTNWVVDGSGQGTIGSYSTIDNGTTVRVVDVNSNTRFSVNTISGFSASTTYIFSVKYRKVSGTPTLRFQIAWYNSSNVFLSYAFPLTSEIKIYDLDGWQLAQYTATSPINTSKLTWFIQDGDDYTTYTHSYDLKEPQIQAGLGVSQWTATSYSANTLTGGGGLLDISGNNVNADLTNVLFNGNGYYFNAASSTRIIAKTYTATDTFCRNLGAISIWFKTSTNQNGVLVGWGDDGNTNFGSIQITADWTGGFADESLIAESYNATASQRAVLRKGANYYANGIWNNVTAVFDDNYLNLMIYINGVLETTSNNGSSSGAPFLNVSTSTSYFNIGRRTYGAGTEYFTGEIGQVLVYGKILTAAEVLQNFNATRKTYGL